MHLKTYLSVALVLVLAMGMGCGGGSSISTTTGGDSSSTVIGTWNRADSNVTFPQTIDFNVNGGAYHFSSGATTPFSWSQSGNQVTIIPTGATQSATANLTSANTFTLNSLGQADNYTRL